MVPADHADFLLPNPAIIVFDRCIQVLTEVAQQLPDGRRRERYLPVSEKLLAAEDWVAAVPRAVAEELGSVLDGVVGWQDQVGSAQWLRLTSFLRAGASPGRIRFMAAPATQPCPAGRCSTEANEVFPVLLHL